MSAETLFAAIGAIGILAGLARLVYRHGIRRGTESQQLVAAGIRMKAIDELGDKVSDVKSAVDQVQFALIGAMGSPGLVGRVDKIEERLEAIELQLLKGAR